jgi:hypothetical protein
MKRTLGFAVMCVTMAGAASMLPDAPHAMQPDARAGCLHGPDETDAGAKRRAAAITYVRSINTAQARRPGQGAWLALNQLAVSPAPAGFSVQLGTFEGGYLVSTKDTLDPCRYALFSDSTGLIYVGRPMQ